jgi:hypothetical protein
MTTAIVAAKTAFRRAKGFSSLLLRVIRHQDAQLWEPHGQRLRDRLVTVRLQRPKSAEAAVIVGGP